MTDLEERIDQSTRNRMVTAIRGLGRAEYQEVVASLIDKMGVNAREIRTEGDSVIVEGKGEDDYLILATRMELADPEHVARSLFEEAKEKGLAPVFMTLQRLDEGTLEYLRSKNMSFADQERFVTLLEKYGLAGSIDREIDRRVLEERGEPCLPSVCKLENLMEEADRHMEKGERAMAISCYDRALEIKPLNDSLWLRRASALMEMGRLQDALASAMRASELRSGDANTWYLIAIIHNGLGDAEKELTAYDNVLRINPAHAPALLNKGATLFELGRLDWALKVYNDLVKKYPQNPSAWNNRGLVLRAQGKGEEARASFERALIIDREYEDPFINIALLLEDQGDWSAASEQWKEALRLVDSRPDLWYKLGLSLLKTGMEEDAFTAIVRAWEIDPLLPGLRDLKSELEARLYPPEGTSPTEERPPSPLPAIREGTTALAETEEAALPVPTEGTAIVEAEEVEPPSVITGTTELEVPEEASLPVGTEKANEPPIDRKLPFKIELSELDIAPRANRAYLTSELLALLGRTEEALLTIESISDEATPSTLRAKGRYLLEQGKVGEALDAHKEAFKMDPRNCRNVLDLEALSHRFGLREESLKILEGVGSAEAKARMAWELLAEEKYQELASLDVEGDSAMAKHAKALALMRMGRYRDASKLLKVVLSETPAFAEGLNNLGVCMRFMGEYDYDQAMHFMHLALEVAPDYGDAYNNIGCVLFVSGRYQEALDLFESAIRVDRRPTYLLNLSNAQLALGLMNEAKTSLTSALKMEEGPDVLFMLGSLAERDGDSAWAMRLYEDALAMKQDFREAIAARDRIKALSKK